MRPLDEAEYRMLTTTFKDVIVLAEHKIVGRGYQILIPIYERITETRLNPKCESCQLDMCIVLSIAVKNYEQDNKEPTQPQIIPNQAESNINTVTPKVKRNRIKNKLN